MPIGRSAVVATATVMILSGCGSSNSTNPAATTSGTTLNVSVSTTPSAAPSSTTPTPSQPSLADTAPRGVFTVTRSVVSTTPAKSNVSLGTHDAFTWTFATKACTATSCTGTITSSSGAKYVWTWNGSTLGLTRAPEKETWPCKPTGSVGVTYNYTFSQMTTTKGTDGGVAALTVLASQTLSFAEKNCTVAADQYRALTLKVTAKKR